jgi:diguanylate cyclase (GGDEF)-like protein
MPASIAPASPPASCASADVAPPPAAVHAAPDAPAHARPLPRLSDAEHRARLTSPTRLAALHASGLLDGTANPVLDRLARLTAELLQVPVALVSLVDGEAQHFPGLAGLGGWAGTGRGTPLSHSFCQHVVAGDQMLLVEDAAAHPLVFENLAFRELGVIAYAGVPLRTADGETLGALCAIDTAPARWTERQVRVLEDMAAAAMAEIELRATTNALLASQAQLQTAHERLKAQAVRDQLTGLLNRRGFADAARQQMALAARGGLPFLIVALDLDGFKAINDIHGHDVGDAALVELAVLLKQTCRAADVLARFGGDEFVLLLPDTSAIDADAVYARLLAAVAAQNAEPDREYQLATSIGIASWAPTPAPDARRAGMPSPASLPALLKDADEAMYADKRARRLTRDAVAFELPGVPA